MPIQTISRPFVGLAEQPSFAQRLATRLYSAARGPCETEVSIRLATRNAVSGTTTTRPITLVCISDTHNTTLPHLPAGDILLHAGDLSQFGTFAEIQAQLTWLAAQPHPHKVVVAGNHDLLLDTDFVARHPDRELDRHPGRRRSDLDWGHIRYLEHGTLDLVVPEKGRSIRIFGSPWTPRCGNWAFQYAGGARERSVTNWTGAVPPGTDVMLVHGPPKGHLDHGGKGCGRLLAEIWRAKPKLVVCGHIHAGRGEEWLAFDGVDAWYDNVMLGKRRWVSVARLALGIFFLLAARAVGLGTRHRQTINGTHLVNAAVVGAHGRRRDAIVVRL